MHLQRMHRQSLPERGHLDVYSTYLWSRASPSAHFVLPQSPGKASRGGGGGCWGSMAGSEEEMVNA